MSGLLSLCCFLGLSAFTSRNGWDEAFGATIAAGSAVFLLRASNSVASASNEPFSGWGKTFLRAPIVRGDS